MPCSGLILEWARERRGEEQSLLAAIFPDQGLHVADFERVRGFVIPGDS